MARRRGEIADRLWLDGDVVCYESAVYRSWRLDLAGVRLIGEFTNEAGPFRDDYFLCFANDESDWLEASFYSNGRDEFLQALGERLDADLLLSLSGSTSFASRILYPVSLEGQPMFDFESEKPRGIWRRAMNFIAPRTNQRLSKGALSVLTESVSHSE